MSSKIQTSPLSPHTQETACKRNADLDYGATERSHLNTNRDDAGAGRGKLHPTGAHFASLDGIPLVAQSLPNDTAIYPKMASEGIEQVLVTDELKLLQGELAQARG